MAIEKHLLYIYSARYKAITIANTIKLRNEQKDPSVRKTLKNAILIDAEEMDDLVRQADIEIRIYDPAYDGGSISHDHDIEKAYEMIQEMLENEKR